MQKDLRRAFEKRHSRNKQYNQRRPRNKKQLTYLIRDQPIAGTGTDHEESSNDNDNNDDDNSDWTTFSRMYAKLPTNTLHILTGRPTKTTNKTL